MPLGKIYKAPKRAPKKFKNSLVKTVRSEIQKAGELRISDQDITAQNGGTIRTVSTAGVLVDLQLLSLITKGDNKQYNRQGTRINLKDMNVCGQTYIGAGALADATNAVRVIIIQWLKSAGTLASISQVLYSYSSGGFKYNSQYNPENAGDFIVHYDNLHLMSAAGTRTTKIKKYKSKGLHRKIVFDDITGGGAPDKGEFFLIAVSDSTAVDHPLIDFNIRIRYTDM